MVNVVNRLFFENYVSTHEDWWAKGKKIVINKFASDSQSTAQSLNTTKYLVHRYYC